MAWRVGERRTRAAGALAVPGLEAGGGTFIRFSRIPLPSRFTVDDQGIVVYTIIMIWNETKRQMNLEKHQLDFADARLVLSNRYRLVFEIVRNGEVRRQAFAYVAEVLTVLTVIWLPGEKQRIISFRRAHKYEREAYHAWLEKDFTD
jgi:uncharacterized protein